MEAHDHECLWNGPVWPFATSQVLVALANMLHREHDTAVTCADYVRLLRQYACAHRRTLEDGREIDWIDENMDPETGEWLSRRILEAGGWKRETGGYERGRDYNHSLFCDLVLSGLLGIRAEEGKLCAEPLIPDEWTHFRVENLYVGGRVYSITYDQTMGMTIQTP